MDPQNNSDSIKVLRCPNCFGTVDFVPGKQKIVCQFCGCEFDIDQKSDDGVTESVNPVMSMFSNADTATTSDVTSDQSLTATSDVMPAQSTTITSGATSAQLSTTTSVPSITTPDTSTQLSTTTPAASGTESTGISISPDTQPSSPIQGFDFTQFYEGVKQEDSENLPIYYCKSCGAEVIAANEEASLTCPYCTNKIVLSNKVSGKFRPDGIIPFKIPQSELKKHLDDFYKDKKLLPRNFFSQSKMEKVTGIYVPFWLFSGTVGGDFVYKGDKVKTSVSGDYNVTETSTYNVQRSGQVTFENIPLDASEKIDDALMDSVLPYDFSEVKNFNYQYLAGFAADRFDVPGKSLQKRAEDRMINTTAKKATSSVRSEYINVSMKNNYLKAVNVKVKYILLPVYLFSIKHDGTKYEFSVNGQTGKVVGNLPIDKKVCIWYRLKKSLIPAAVVALYFILSYFLG